MMKLFEKIEINNEIDHHKVARASAQSLYSHTHYQPLPDY